MEQSLKILADAGGVGVWDCVRDRVLWRIRWEEVKEIVAWKDVDEAVCLGFRSVEEPEYARCDQEMSGWVMLVAELQRRFGIPWNGWWGKVATAELERNWTVIWGEAWPLPCARCGYDLRASKDRCPECGAAIPERRIGN